MEVLTPKEKAKQLFEIYFNNMPIYLQGKLGRRTAKLNALVCVSEILETIKIEYSIQDLNYKWWLKVQKELKDNFN